MGYTELNPDEPANKANVPCLSLGGPELRHDGSETMAPDLAAHASGGLES